MRMSRPPAWLAALLCVLQLLVGPGAHAQASAPAGRLTCGMPTLDGIAMLAELAPSEYAKALHALVGADDHCRAHCAAGALPLPTGAPRAAFALPVHALPRIATAAARPAARAPPPRPPSTAPPSQA